MYRVSEQFITQNVSDVVEINWILVRWFFFQLPKVHSVKEAFNLLISYKEVSERPFLSNFIHELNLFRCGVFIKVVQYTLLHKMMKHYNFFSKVKYLSCSNTLHVLFPRLSQLKLELCLLQIDVVFYWKQKFLKVIFG